MNLTVSYRRVALERTEGITDGHVEGVQQAARGDVQRPVDPQISEPDPEWNRYLGTYRAWWADLRVLMLRGELVLIYPQAQDPGGYLLTLVPRGGGSFRVEGDGFDETGELLTFERNDAGEIVGMTLAGQYYKRVDPGEYE
jgi:hypothetical protein